MHIYVGDRQDETSRRLLPIPFVLVRTSGPCQRTDSAIMTLYADTGLPLLCKHAPEWSEHMTKSLDFLVPYRAGVLAGTELMEPSAVTGHSLSGNYVVYQIIPCLSHTRFIYTTVIAWAVTTLDKVRMMKVVGEIHQSSGSTTQ